MPAPTPPSASNSEPSSWIGDSARPWVLIDGDEEGFRGEREYEPLLVEELELEVASIVILTVVGAVFDLWWKTDEDRPSVPILVGGGGEKSSDVCVENVRTKHDLVEDIRSKTSINRKKGWRTHDRQLMQQRQQLP